MVSDTRAAPANRDEAAPGRLHGSLGVSSIVFMVVAAAAPLTVVAGTVPIGIALGNGAGFPATYLACSAILLLFAVGFTTMARHLPRSGGFYAYVGHGLGRGPGLGAAFLALLTYAAVLVAVYGYLGAAIDGLAVQHLGVSAPWWVWSLGVLAMVGVLGYRHIDLSSRVLGVLLVAEVAVVVLIDAVVLARGGSEGLSIAPLDPGVVLSGSVGIALIFALAGFLGFEATVIFRDEARDPDRTIPRATYASLVIIGAFYAISSWAVVSAWGDAGAVARAGADPGTMLAETAQVYVGTVVADVVGVLLVSSLVAAAVSFHNVTARYLFSLGSTGVLPAACGRSHRSHGSPYAGSLVVTAVSVLAVAAAVALGLDPVLEVFAWLAGVATVGVVALMALTCLAIVVFFRRTRVAESAWATLVAPSAGLLALGGCLALTLANLPLLVGGSTRLAVVIDVVLVAALLAGPVVARLRTGAFAAEPEPAP